MKEILGEKLYTSEEAAALLGVNKKSIYRYTATGVLRCVHMGGSLYMSDTALREFVQGAAQTHGLKARRTKLNEKTEDKR